MRSFNELLSLSSFDLFRPVVFLLSRPETSLTTDAEVLNALAASGKQAREVMQVPAFTSGRNRTPAVTSMAFSPET